MNAVNQLDLLKPVKLHLAENSPIRIALYELVADPAIVNVKMMLNLIQLALADEQSGIDPRAKDIARRCVSALFARREHEDTEEFFRETNENEMIFLTASMDPAISVHHSAEERSQFILRYLFTKLPDAIITKYLRLQILDAQHSSS